LRSVAGDNCRRLGERQRGSGEVAQKVAPDRRCVQGSGFVPRFDLVLRNTSRICVARGWPERARAWRNLGKEHSEADMLGPCDREREGETRESGPLTGGLHRRCRLTGQQATWVGFAGLAHL
jgi:hypothetical protein